MPQVRVSPENKELLDAKRVLESKTIRDWLSKVSKRLSMQQKSLEREESIERMYRLQGEIKVLRWFLAEPDSILKK